MTQGVDQLETQSSSSSVDPYCFSQKYQNTILMAKGQGVILLRSHRSELNSIY